jgi:hypothetical protein
VTTTTTAVPLTTATDRQTLPTTPIHQHHSSADPAPLIFAQ